MDALNNSSDPVADQSSDRPRRGFLFYVWLTVLSIGAVITSFYAITNVPRIIEEMPEAPVWVLWSKVGMSLMNVGFLGAIWLWKRWGLYGLALSSLAIFLINIFAGFTLSEAGIGLVAVTVLYLLLLPKKIWRHFR